MSIDLPFSEEEREKHLEALEATFYDPEFTEPIEALLEKAARIDRGEPGTHGATPLDQLRTFRQQDALLKELLEYTYGVPDGISLQLAAYIHETFGDRFNSRATANNDNYTTSLLNKSVYEDNTAIMEVIDRGETGHASAAELLLVQKLLGIRSVELACLTHPYGERMDPLLYEMRDLVAMSILALGGELSEEVEPNFRVKEVILNDVPVEKWAEVYTLNNTQRLALADNYGGISGFLMTRKREIGRMPDGTIIKERSSFVLRADSESPVTQRDIDAMREVPFSCDWQDEVVKAAHLDEIAGTLLHMNEHTFAVPLASTIYAHNLQFAEMTRRRHGVNESLHYTIGRASVMALQASDEREIREYGNMVFVGLKGRAPLALDDLEEDAE